MKPERKTYKIGELGRIVTGKTPALCNPIYFGETYPFITPTDMRGQKYAKTDRSLSDEGAKHLKSCLIPANSVAVSCIGWQMGKSIMTDKPSVTNQQLNSIIPNDKVLPDFLYYSLLMRRDELLSLGAGTGVRTPILNKTAFSELSVEVPSLETQRKIASILSAYDDLIENNTWRIKILEVMARMIYREWFVNFRFPGHEQVKMIDSPLGMVPEGWEVTKIGDLLEKTPKKKKIQKQDYLESGEIPVIDQGKDFIGGYTSDDEARIEAPLPLIVFGDHTRALKFIDFPFASGADGTQLLRAKTPKMPISLFYYALQSVDLSNFAYARHFKFLKEEILIVPDQRTADLFEKNIGKIRELIRRLTKKNQNLRQTRDLLLPKLISGEVAMSELCDAA